MMVRRVVNGCCRGRSGCCCGCGSSGGSSGGRSCGSGGSKKLPGHVKIAVSDVRETLLDVAQKTTRGINVAQPIQVVTAVTVSMPNKGIVVVSGVAADLVASAIAVLGTLVLLLLVVL